MGILTCPIPHIPQFPADSRANGGEGRLRSSVQPETTFPESFYTCKRKKAERRGCGEGERKRKYNVLFNKNLSTSQELVNMTTASRLQKPVRTVKVIQEILVGHRG